MGCIICECHFLLFEDLALGFVMMAVLATLMVSMEKVPKKIMKLRYEGFT